VPVATSALREHSPVVAADGEGGAYVAMLVDTADGGGQVRTGVCAQRLAADGTLPWLGGARSVVVQSADCRCGDLAIAACPEGGAYVAYRRVRTVSGQPAGEVVVQRLAPDGTIVWKDRHPDGLVLAGDPDARGPVLIAARQGAIWVVLCSENSAPRVSAQFVRPDGQITGPVPLSGALRGSPGDVQAVSDGSGGLLCVFGLSSRQTPAKLFCARIDGAGKHVWPGIAALFSGPGMSYREVCALPGPDSSVTVAMTSPVNRRLDANQHRALAAQHISASGELTWGLDPIEVTNPADGSAVTPALAPDGEGGVYVVYGVKLKTGPGTGATGLLSLRLGPSGGRLWRHPIPLAMGLTPGRAPVLVEGA